jgi:hypothetical protein
VFVYKSSYINCYNIKQEKFADVQMPEKCDFNKSKICGMTCAIYGSGRFVNPYTGCGDKACVCP